MREPSGFWPLASLCDPFFLASPSAHPSSPSRMLVSSSARVLSACRALSWEQGGPAFPHTPRPADHSPLRPMLLLSPCYRESAKCVRHTAS